MPPPSTPARPKRVRKRKRQQASSSESSADSSSSDSEPNSAANPASKSLAGAKKPAPVQAASDSSSSSSSSDDSSSDDDMGVSKAPAAGDSKRAKSPSRSPSPIRGDLPPFLPTEGTLEERQKHEAQLKERFRKFWMNSVGEAFKDDLDKLRQEPNLTESKLSVLIDALGAGAGVFSSKAAKDLVNEMELVLDGKS